MKLLRSIATVGSFTIGSRITGFVRETLMASLLGASAISDAFIVAIKLPSLFRRILAEGAMNAAFVPIFSGLLASKGEKEAKTFAEEIFALLILILSSLVVIIEIFLPLLMPLFLPGFQETPGRLALAIEFSRITFPFIFLISLTALYSGILNSFEKFAAVASSPMVGNIALILSVYGFLAFNLNIGIAFSMAILVCGIVQMVWVLIPLIRRGFHLRWIKPRWSPRVKHFFKLMAPAALGSGVVQLSIFIDTLIASCLPAGSISYIHYADRLSQFPLSVLGTAIGTALLPLLSKQIRSRDYHLAQDSQNLALEYAILFSIPATLILMILAEPLIRVIFEHRAFQANATLPTARTLTAFASGLPAYVLIKIFTTSFFAREDTKTPVLVALLSVALNVIISLALLKTLKHVGIALATSVSAWLNAFLLGFLLWRQKTLHFNERFQKFLPRVLVSGLLTIFFMTIVDFSFQSVFQESFLKQLCYVILFTGLSLSGFFGFSQWIGAFHYKDFQTQFRKDSFQSL